MQTTLHQPTKQPTPFTPGMDKHVVRQHAFKLYHDKLKHADLSLEDWVLAEKDLLEEMEQQNEDSR